MFFLFFSFQSSLHPCNGQKLSLTEVRRAKIVTLHGEGNTKRDIAAKLRCCKTAVHNAMLMARFMTGNPVLFYA